MPAPSPHLPHALSFPGWANVYYLGDTPLMDWEKFVANLINGAESKLHRTADLQRAATNGPVCWEHLVVGGADTRFFTGSYPLFQPAFPSHATC